VHVLQLAQASGVLDDLLGRAGEPSGVSGNLSGKRKVPRASAGQRGAHGRRVCASEHQLHAGVGPSHGPLPLLFRVQTHEFQHRLTTQPVDRGNQLTQSPSTQPDILETHPLEPLDARKAPAYRHGIIQRAVASGEHQDELRHAGR
jgi:hypothetical protein